MRRLAGVVGCRLLVFLAAVGFWLGWGPHSAQLCRAQELHTPQGVRVLENKSFNDSDEARREILDLYRGLRVTDVCDGMDLIGLQDVGLMDNSIRPLWRDTEKLPRTKIPLDFSRVSRVCRETQAISASMRVVRQS